MVDCEAARAMAPAMTSCSGFWSGVEAACGDEEVLAPNPPSALHCDACSISDEDNVASFQ